MVAHNEQGLCEQCFYRQDSRQRVADYVQIRLSRGDTPPLAGMVCDPAPRAECKRHEGYMVEPAETLIECSDFIAIELSQPELEQLFLVAWKMVHLTVGENSAFEHKLMRNLCLQNYVDWEPQKNSYSITEKGFARLSHMARLALQRPADFIELSPEERWAIDKKLGILDWDGSC